MHVDYVGADTIQEVLGVGYQHEDPLEPVAPHKLLETKLGKEFLLVAPDGDKGFICTRSLAYNGIKNKKIDSLGDALGNLE